MKGFVIFRHAVRQLVMGIGPALRISAVLWISTAALGYVLDVYGDLARYQVMVASFGSGLFPWQSVLPYTLLSFAAAAWIGVGWHRYILLNEASGAILPRFRAGRVLGYMVKIVQVTLAGFILGLVAGAAVGVVIGLLQGLHLLSPAIGTFLIIIIAGLIGLLIGARLSLALPAPAIGAKLSLLAAWRATQGQSWQILLAIILLVLVFIAVSLPLVLLFQPLTAPAVIWQSFSTWVTMMLGLSLTTTLYGHYVEGRPLV